METIIEFAVNLASGDGNNIVPVLSVISVVAALFMLIQAARIMRQTSSQTGDSNKLNGEHINKLIGIVQEFGDTLQDSAVGTINKMNDLIDQLVNVELENQDVLADIDARATDLPEDVVKLIKPELKSLEDEVRRSLRDAETRIVSKILEAMNYEKNREIDSAAGRDDLVADRMLGAEPSGGEVRDLPS